MKDLGWYKMYAARDGITRWMGNRPGVGLTTSEAGMISRAVTGRVERSSAP
ncbi:hypothetical protein L4X63_19505 [Geomonas sp. Red32]|uniref:hypothetical protein n=1 Tax=Geomonas sp. Red32 TaxID=2912856 RepID=UPI00202D0930|nr:hypothetical protein [Geomonas sp. Red32]MCM0083778.1 hypothetical protein [Geomonas sp. Red32]